MAAASRNAANTSTSVLAMEFSPPRGTRRPNGARSDAMSAPVDAIIVRLNPALGDTMAPPREKCSAGRSGELSNQRVHRQRDYKRRNGGVEHVPDVFVHINVGGHRGENCGV